MADENLNAEMQNEQAPFAREGLFFVDALTSQEQVADLLRLGQRATEPNAVFSEPVVLGERVIITASEISGGLGMGFGSGGDAKGQGGAGGGGGGSFGRPVAMIIVEPQGVRFEPIVDVTKLGIAFFTTLGAMFLGWRAMGRGGK
jgi:hypothetical protein